MPKGFIYLSFDSHETEKLFAAILSIFKQIKNERDSLSAEDNILKFLQTCHSLGIEKVMI